VCHKKTAVLGVEKELELFFRQGNGPVEPAGIKIRLIKIDKALN